MEEYLTICDWETGNLALHNLKTGESKPVTHEGTLKDSIQYVEFSLISPDGKQVAYNWYNGYKAEFINYELRLIKVGSQTPVILYSCSKDEYMTPELWFSNGKKIIAQNYNSKNKIWQLFSVNVTSGEIKLIKEKESGPSRMVNLSLSPDEKYIAFDLPNPSDKGKYDINLISIDPKIELPLIAHPANDRLLGWLPGRNELLFTSDRSGTTDVLAVNTSNGKPLDEPKRILANTGDISPMGFKRDGSLYYSIASNNFQSYIVPIDQSTGKLSNTPRTSLSGQVYDVCWMPDGESLICRQYLQEPDKSWVYKLIISNIKTGENHILANNINATGSQRISPDSKSVLVFGIDNQRSEDKNYKGGIYSVDIKTGIPVEIKVKQDASQSFIVDWDKEGKNIFYTSANQIIKHNIETGEETILYTDKNMFFTPTLRRSFDGKHLLFDVLVNMNEGERHLLSIPVDGGEARTLCVFNGALALRFKKNALSPDGKYIYFSTSSPEARSILCWIPAGGGTPEKLWQSKDFIAGISIHPDGKQIALSVYEIQTEIRVIENMGKEVTEIFSKNE